MDIQNGFTFLPLSIQYRARRKNRTMRKSGDRPSTPSIALTASYGDISGRAEGRDARCMRAAMHGENVPGGRIPGRSGRRYPVRREAGLQHSPFQATLPVPLPVPLHDADDGGGAACLRTCRAFRFGTCTTVRNITKGAAGTCKFDRSGCTARLHRIFRPAGERLTFASALAGMEAEVPPRKSLTDGTELAEGFQQWRRAAAYRNMHLRETLS